MSKERTNLFKKDVLLFYEPYKHSLTASFGIELQSEVSKPPCNNKIILVLKLAALRIIREGNRNIYVGKRPIL